jgi:GNAT superfamily N-acetyltransferase
MGYNTKYNFLARMLKIPLKVESGQYKMDFIHKKEFDNLSKCTDVPNYLPYFIYNVINESVINSNDPVYSPIDIQRILDRKSLDLVKNDIVNRYVLTLINDNNDIMAFSALSKRGDHFYVNWFQVTPKYRGLGLGTVMLTHLENYTVNKGISRIYLESFLFPKALALYKKSGFLIHNNQSGLFDLKRMYKDVIQS